MERNPYLCGMIRTKKILALLLLGWFASFSMMADEMLWSGLSYRRYTTQDGLPQMQCEKVWQDSHGYIYIGTLSGFARFDGREMTPFLRGRRWNIVGFAEQDGQVQAMDFRRRWLVSGNKVEMQPLTSQGGWLLNNLNAGDLPDGYLLIEDEQEEHRRLCRLMTGGSLDTLLTSPLLDLMLPDRKLYVDGNSVYIPTHQGVYVGEIEVQEFKSSSLQEARGEETMISEKGDVYSFCRADDVLYAFADDGIYVVEDSLRLVAPAPDGLSPDYGVTARRLQGGGLVMADGHSLYVFDGHSIRREATGLNLIRDIFVDRWDRLWVASYQGLYCYFARQFTNHRLLDDNDLVRCMAFDGDGRLVCGTLNGKAIVREKGIAIVREKGIVKSEKEREKVVYDNAADFFQPSTAVIGGRVYLAGRSDVVCVHGDSLSWLGIGYNRCQFLAEADGKLVVGTRQAILQYDPERRTIDTLSTEIAHPWGAAADQEGTLWVASTFGLYQVKGGQTTQVDYEGRSLVVTTLDGVNGNLNVNANLNLNENLKGTICFASVDSLFLIRNGQVSCLNSQVPQLSGHEVKAVHLSPRGYLVVAAIDGLLVCRIDEECRVVDAAFFDHQQGFTLIEPQKATIAEEADGTVWVAGLEGMTSFLPERLLESSHADTYIAPPPSWWQRWWWLVLVAGIALLTWLVALLERRRQRRKMVVMERAKKQKELQLSAVRLRAIPHFHSNVMAAIEYFLMNNSADEATRYLKLYSDFTNQTLCDIDRPARTLAEELDYVRMYLQLEQLRYGERLEYDIDVEDDTDMESLMPTMLIYTYCQNAVKHGLATKPEGGRVSIKVSPYSSSPSGDKRGAISGDKRGAIFGDKKGTLKGLTVQVSDNGIGREAAARLSQDSTKQGLRILEEQIELYNQANKRPIVQRVTDLFDPEGQPAGTRFEMTIPDGYQWGT